MLTFGSVRHEILMPEVTIRCPSSASVVRTGGRESFEDLLEAGPI